VERYVSGCTDKTSSLSAQLEADVSTRRMNIQLTGFLQFVLFAHPLTGLCSEGMFGVEPIMVDLRVSVEILCKTIQVGSSLELSH